VHEFFEFVRLVSAELINGNLLLLLLDIGILLCFGSTWETLPRKRASEEIQKDVSNCFQIVSSGLFITNVGIERGISGSTCEVFAVSEWDVLTTGALVAFGEAKINDVDCVFRLVVTSNEEIVRLNVSMDDSLLMHNLDSLNHLNGDVED